jgi:hypothetical protein
MLNLFLAVSVSIYGQRDNGIDGRRRALRAAVGLSGA